MNVNKDQAVFYLELSGQHQTQYAMKFFKQYLSPGMNVLDVGCGTGNICPRVLEIIGANGSILGIDPDVERVKKAQKKYSEAANVRFLACKGSQIPTAGNEGRFDLVVSNAVFHWMDSEEKSQTLKRIHIVLKQSGTFLLQYVDRLPIRFCDLANYLGLLEYAKSLIEVTPAEEMIMFCKSAGFTVLSCQSDSFTSYWESLKTFCSFSTAVFHDCIDYNVVYHKIEKELNGEIPTAWLEDNKIAHITPLVKCVLQK